MGKKVKCWVCGAEHDYCPVCGQTQGWKFVADTPEHYQIYMVMKEYEANAITKDKAAETLEKSAGINAKSDLSWMIPAVAKVVRSIVEDTEKPTKTTKKETKSKLFE